MIVSSLREYIKDKKSVSMTQILLELDTSPDEIEGPLMLLLNKKYVLKEQLESGESPKEKCKGCPMHCNQDVKDNCDPGSNSITVYSWNRH